MSVLISAALANVLPLKGVPDEIVYIPEGLSDITPFVNGKAQAIKVKVNASNGAIAAGALQSTLDRRLSNNVRPWTDFEHKAGASSGNPKAFRTRCDACSGCSWVNHVRSRAVGSLRLVKVGRIAAGPDVSCHALQGQAPPPSPSSTSPGTPHGIPG